MTRNFIQLIVGGRPVYLSPDTKIRMEFKSGINDFENIPISKAYWFDIPANEPNTETFEYVQFVEIFLIVDGKKTKFRSYSANLIIGGVHNINGKIVLNKASEKSYRTCFTVGEMDDDFKEKKLPDINYGNDVTLGADADEIITTLNEDYVSQSYPDVNFQFPEIYNPELYGEDNNFDFSGVINLYDGINETYVKNTINEDPIKDNITCLIPQLFLFFVIDKVLAEQGFIKSGDIFLDNEFKKLLIYNNYTLDKKVDKFGYFKGFRNDHPVNELLSGISVYYTHILNFSSLQEVEDTDNKFSTDEYTIDKVGYYQINIKYQLQIDDEVDLKIVVDKPFPELPEELYAETAYYTTPNGWWQEKELLVYVDQNMIDNLGYIKVSMVFHKHNGSVDQYLDIFEYRMEIFPVSQWNLNIFDGVVKYKNHVPDITVSKFINSIRKGFALVVFWDFVTKKSHFIHLEKIVNYPIIDNWTNKFVPGKELSIEDSKVFEFDFQWDTSDEYVKDNFKSITDFTIEGTQTNNTTLPNSMNVNGLLFITILNAYLVSNVSEANYYIWNHFVDYWLSINKDKGTIKIEPDWSPLLLESSICPITGGYKLRPKINSRGSSIAFNNGINSCPFRLMFYRGQVKEVNSDYFYPHAGALAYNPVGTITYNYELLFNQSRTRSLYNKRWKTFVDWYTPSVPVKVNLIHEIDDFMELFRVDENGIPGLLRKKMIDSTLYLIDTINYVFTMDGIEECQADLIKGG